MRVGVVCPYSFAFPGGVQRQCAQWSNWLSEHGHSVSLLAPDVEGADGIDDRVRRFPAGPTMAYRWNGSVARVGMGPRVRRQVQEWLRDSDFDVVHLHEPMTPSASFLAWGRWRGPTVATVHTAREQAWLHQVGARLHRARLDRLRHVIAVSDQAAQLARRYLRVDPVIIPNALEVPKTPVPGVRGAAPSVLFFGRNEVRKGLPLFLECAPTLLARGWQVDVAGSATSVPDGVRAHGVVDDVERRRLMQAADVFIAPHLHGESFGIALAEAVAAGCRVAASDLPSFGWLAEVGASVEYFSTGDGVGLIEAVERAYRLPASDPRCLAPFSWDAVGPPILDIYERVVRPVATRQ